MHTLRRVNLQGLRMAKEARLNFRIDDGDYAALADLAEKTAARSWIMSGWSSPSTANLRVRSQRPKRNPLKLAQE